MRSFAPGVACTVGASTSKIDAGENGAHHTLFKCLIVGLCLFWLPARPACPTTAPTACATGQTLRTQKDGVRRLGRTPGDCSYSKRVKLLVFFGVPVGAELSIICGAQQDLMRKGCCQASVCTTTGTRYPGKSRPKYAGLCMQPGGRMFWTLLCIDMASLGTQSESIQLVEASD